MNGRVSRRIRRASAKSGRPVKELKREYRRLPYHRRRLGIRGLRSLSHLEEERRWRFFIGS